MSDPAFRVLFNRREIIGPRGKCRLMVSEYAILERLLCDGGEIVSYAAVGASIDATPKPGLPVNRGEAWRSLFSHVWRLRIKLEHAGLFRIIDTIPGAGYLVHV